MPSALRLFWGLFGLFTLLCLSSPSTEAANVLGLFSHPGKSHFDFFRSIFLGLAKTGHKVDVVSFFPNKEKVENYTDYQLTGVPLLTDVVDIMFFDGAFEIEAMPIKAGTFFMLHDWGMDSCRVAFKSEHLKKILKSGKKYDVVILEQFNNDCMMAVAHLLKAPVVALSSCSLMPWHYKRMGSPMLLSHMPMNLLPHHEEMTFLQRLNNFLHFHIVNELYNYVTQPATNALIREHFGADVPPIEELVKRTSLMLVNQHYSLAGAYPYTPNVIEVGGLQIPESRPLDADLQRILDNSPAKGVVYISWGSMIRPETLPDEKRDALLKTIAEFSDYLFLMKWPDNKLPATKPANLVTRPWMPQRDILCHPKVRAFMAHGGLLGTSEAIHCGVPMLVTPFYGDQFLNSMAISRRKFGLVVKYKDLNQKNIGHALRVILSPSFAGPVRKISESYRKRPMKPLDLALWWIEHVIATDGAPLAQSYAIELNAFIYSCWDIYLFLAGVAFVLYWITRRILCLILRLLQKGQAKSKKKKAD